MEDVKEKKDNKEEKKESVEEDKSKEPLGNKKPWWKFW